MWIVQWLPDSWVLFFTYLILTIGVASYIGSKLLVWVPPIYKYKLVVEILGVLLFSSGAYLYGGRVVEQIWQARVTELEAKLKVAETKSKEINTIIETKVITKIKVIKETVYANKEIIKEVVGKQLDAKCELPVSTVVLLNSSSQNEVSRGAGSTDGTPSDVKASDLLGTVVENYGTYYEIREKLIGWQTWYKEQKKIFEEAQK